MNKKISSVQLHDVMFIPTIGEVKKTLNTQSHPGIKMSYNDNGTLVEVTYRGVFFDIPVVNCKNIVYSVEQPAVAKAK